MTLAALDISPSRLGRLAKALAPVAWLALSLMLAWAPGRLMERQARALEARVLDRDINRVVQGLQGEVLVLDALALDWARWDDTYRFVQDRNPAFIRANLTWESLLQSTRIHLVSILDDQGRLVWGGYRVGDPERALPLPANLSGEKQAPERSGILLTPEGPLLLARQPILRSDGSGPARGTLIMGRLLDDATLARLIQRDALAFRIQDTLRTPPSEAQAARMQRLRAGGYEVDFGPREATVHAFIADLAGDGGLGVTLPWPRDIYVQGHRAALTLSGVILLALVVLGTALFLGFHGYSRTMRRNQDELARLVAQRTEELEAANKALEEASMVDPLTGLKNRRYVDFTLPQDTARALRDMRGQTHPPLSPPGIGDDIIFLLVDMDHFKSVNDTHGHAAGDAVLHQVGELLRRTCRETDLVARWGGEEFLIAARRTNRAYAPTIAGKLLEAFRAHPFRLPDGTLLSKTCSIGYCPFPLLVAHPQAVTWPRALEIADLCLYAAKRSGRDAWVGVTVPEGGGTEALASRLPGGFLDLVSQGALEVHCSHGDPARLNWF